MATPDDKQGTSTLNDLISTLKDGQEGYQHAAGEVKDADLKQLFTEYAQQRAKFLSELQGLVTSDTAETPADSGSVTAAIHRGWIDLKSAVTSQDRHSILAECERGEDVAKKAYAKALDSGTLTGTWIATVQAQQEAVNSAHDDIKRLRDSSK